MEQLMEQVKFRTLPLNADKKKYIFNKVTRSAIATEQSITNKSASFQNLSSNLRNQQLNNGGPRITESRKRTLIKTAKADIINRNLSKETLKKLKKVNTQQSRSSELEMKGMKNLKDYIRIITKICNKIHKSKAERAVAVSQKNKDTNQLLTMNHLSFSEIQQEKIEKQKVYLNNFEHLRRSNSKMIVTAAGSEQRAMRESLVVIYRMVDRLYEILQEMEELGYYKKHNKNIINFCTNTKIWQSKVFLAESSSHKDAFSIKTQWLVVGTSEEAKEKLSDYITKGGKVDFRIISHDIQELVDYLEQSLGQKKLIEISNLGDYIQHRIKECQFEQSGTENVQMLRVFQSKPQQFNFSKELSQLQERYGSMNIVTKVSRRRFQDLSRTYDKLQSLF